MNRKLKALGLALVAVFAMSAFAASNAQATNFFHNHLGEVNPDETILTGTNKIGAGETVSVHKFTPAPAGEAVKCSNATFEGTEIAGSVHETSTISKPFTHISSTSGLKTITSTEVTVTPTYSSCTFAGGAASVTTTGCHYRFTAETDANGHGGVHVECEAGKKIVVEALGCKIEIGSQTPTKQGVHYTNETSSTSTRDVRVESTVGGISYTTNDAFTCTLAGIGTGGSEGEYIGEATVKAYEDKNPVSSTGVTGAYTEGKQLGAWWGPTE